MGRLLRVRYLVLFIVCLMYFISYIDRVNISIAGPLIRSEIHLSPTELGLIFSAFAYPYAAMQILGGFLADRLSPDIATNTQPLLDYKNTPPGVVPVGGVNVGF